MPARCPVLALSCRADQRLSRQLSGAKRTRRLERVAAAIDPKKTSDNAVVFFSFRSPSELSLNRFEPFIIRVVAIEADERRRMNNENTRRGGSAAHQRIPARPA
jgi:hypothetical protein